MKVKALKKKLISAVLMIGMLIVTVPAMSFANENYTAQLVMEAAGNQGEFAKAGDIVTVSVSLQNAGWAQKENGTGLGAGLISLTYDPAVLEYVEIAEEKIITDVFDDIEKNNIVNESKTQGEVLWMGLNSLLENEVSFTDEKTKLLEIRFAVKDDLPQNLDGVISFSYPEKMDFQFGDMDSTNAPMPGIKNAVISPVFYNNVKFDTTPPAVSLDGGSETNFCYSPVTVEISETNGIGSVSLNGEELSAPYTVSQSGTLEVKDAHGNVTVIEITIDDAEYLAAKAAIAKLPENIGFNEEKLIADVRKAADAVTDPTAKSKLDMERLEKAEAVLHALQQEKAALVQKIKKTKFAVTLKQENVALIETLSGQVKALAEKGASFTDEELKNLTDAQTALQDLEERSKINHEALGTLPDAEKILWSDKQTVEQLEAETNALKQLDDTFTQQEETKLSEAKAELQKIDGLKQTAEAEIQAVLNAQLSHELAPQVNSVNEKLNWLNKKGVSSNDVKDYDKFAAAAEKIMDMLHKVNAVTAQINALPQGGGIGFQHEAAIQSAAEELKRLQDEKLDVADEVKAKLSAAQQEISGLKSARADLVKEIAGAELTVDLTKESSGAISALRTKVNALNQRGAAFTQEELKTLTIAESRLKTLQNQSWNVHHAIEKLPAKDQVVWENKQDLDDIKQKMAQLSDMGDVFTEEEKQKIAETQAALDAIQAAAEQLKNEMEALPEQPGSNTAELLADKKDKINALEKLGYDVNKETMGQAAMDRYNDLKEQADQTQDAVSDSKSSPDMQSSSETQSDEGARFPLAGVLSVIAVLLVIGGLTAFAVIKKRKR